MVKKGRIIFEVLR